MRLMKFKDEMTPWRAVALWAKEEFERLGHEVQMVHGHHDDHDVWSAMALTIDLELRCDGQDFRLCRLSPGLRTTMTTYEYDDPRCFDACLADMEQHARKHRERRQPR